MSETSGSNLESRIALLELETANQRETVKDITQRINVQKKIDYRLILAALSVIFVAIGGAWRFADLKVENTLAPLMVTEAQFRTTQATQDRDLTALRLLQNQFSDMQRVDTAKLGITANDLAQVEMRVHNLEQDLTRYRDADAQADNRLQVAIARLGVEVDTLHKKVFSSQPPTLP